MWEGTKEASALSCFCLSALPYAADNATLLNAARRPMQDVVEVG